ncbi:uncharacterized protein LOC133196221 [Saccostrea echinata]|uniref:uncharacterized protein LOC133196221 n=1 Tax=Saccostrea echinata TaxID=191078 RepID=UPI002A81F4E7|nr:uncharacterized protein LOC133196221 [Saccostrea echinata]
MDNFHLPRLSLSDFKRIYTGRDAKFRMAATVAKAPSIPNVQTTPPQVAQNKVVTSNGGAKIIFNGRQDTSGGYPSQFVIHQKLSFTKLPSIVNRMRAETLSSRAKRGRFYKSDSYVDYRFYSWKNLALWSDYQSHLWNRDGSVKTSFRK